MMVYIFGNGNISFDDFIQAYIEPLQPYLERSDISFHLCDFRGVDTLMMEYLKTVTGAVTVFHIGEQPRYLPDRFRTKVSEWILKGQFTTDKARDTAAMTECTHFLAIDHNSDEKRKSGTLRNIERCQELGKISIL